MARTNDDYPRYLVLLFARLMDFTLMQDEGNACFSKDMNDVSGIYSPEVRAQDDHSQ